jgi:hypothetical protein
MDDASRSRRILASVALVDSLGDGLYLAGSALFFTRGLGLPVGEVGLGLTIAGLIGLAVGAEIGRLADVSAPREVFITLMVAQTVAVASYTLVTGLLTLAIAATAAAVCRQGAQAARGAMIGQLAGQDAPALRAYLHAVINVGIAVGAALSGLAVARDTHGAYVVLMLADAVTFILAAAIAFLLPRTPRPVRPEGPNKRLALADHRFVMLTVLSGILSLQFVVSGYLLPLWVVFHTHAPRWLASPLLLLNTMIIVLFQVRVSRRFKGLARAGHAYRLAGIALAGAFVLFAASSGKSSILASGLLGLAMIVASIGELLTLAGAFGLSFGLAPPHAVGEYQGVWNLGFGTSVALGPGLLTLVCLQGGAPGWIGIAALMAAGGIAINALTLKAARTHRSIGVDPPSALDGLAPDPSPAP